MCSYISHASSTTPQVKLYCTTAALYDENMNYAFACKWFKMEIPVAIQRNSYKLEYNQLDNSVLYQGWRLLDDLQENSKKEIRCSFLPKTDSNIILFQRISRFQTFFMNDVLIGSTWIARLQHKRR